MSSSSNSLKNLIDALRHLPGVGQKSAARMAIHLLQHNREGAHALAHALEHACANIAHCTRCNTFTEYPVCDICQDSSRDASQLCVIETPADQAALERTGTYRGYYFVMMGKLSPLDGVRARDIGIEQLLVRAGDGQVAEVIMATNFNAEGEAAAHLIGTALRTRGLRVTRLARGVPIGSELEFIDLSTIAHALEDRR